jgi:hypothetical protein
MALEPSAHRTLATLAGLTALTRPQHSPSTLPHPPGGSRQRRRRTSDLRSAGARHTQRPSSCSDLSGLSDLMPAGDSSQAAGCRALMDLRALAMMAELPNGCDTSGCGCVSVRKSHIILPAVQAVPVSSGRHPWPGPTSCRGIQATELIDFFSTFFFLLRAFASPKRERGPPRGAGLAIACAARPMVLRAMDAHQAWPTHVVRRQCDLTWTAEATNMAKFVSKKGCPPRTPCPTMRIEQQGHDSGRCPLGPSALHSALPACVTYSGLLRTPNLACAPALLPAC